jgi:hypothetical protein
VGNGRATNAGGSRTRLLGSSEMHWSDPISLRLNGIWIQLGSLQGVMGVRQSKTISAFFQHLYTGVRGRARRQAKAPSRGKEMSGVAHGSLVDRRSRRQHVVQLRGGDGPLFHSGSRSIGVQSGFVYSI